MLITSTFFVICAIFIGIYMVVHNKQGKKHYPNWLPLLHFAAIGVGAILVIWAAFQTQNVQLWSNIVIAIIVSALGFMLSWGKWRRSTSKTILTAHIVIATGCTLFLINNTMMVS